MCTEVFWENVEESVSNGLYGMVEYALGTVRINFFQLISPSEFKSYGDDCLLRYDRKSHPQGLTRRLFVILCQKFMEGPVTMVCKRLNCTKQVLSEWYPWYFVLQQHELEHPGDHDGKLVCGAIMNMHKCTLIMESIISRKRSETHTSVSSDDCLIEIGQNSSDTHPQSTGTVTCV